MITQLASVDRAAIKTGFRLSVQDVGGLAAAETVCRLQKSAIAECYDPHRPERMPPIDVVADLEHVGGRVRVTAILARLAGYALVPLPEGQDLPTARLAAMFQRAAEVGATWARASEDGRLDPDERRAMADEVLQLQAACMQVVAALLNGLPEQGGEG